MKLASPQAWRPITVDLQPITLFRKHGRMLNNDDARTLRRDWNLFTALTFLFSFGFAIYMGVFQNYLRDVQHAGPLQLGGLESLREIPGFLTAITTGTLVDLAESRVAGLGLLIAGIGVGATGQVPSFGPLIAVTIFWSVGFHLYAAMSPVITLTLAQGQEGGRHLGRMGAVGSVATLAGLGVAWVIKQVLPTLPYAAYFYLAGGCIISSGVLCMALGKHSASTEPRARLILRREYSLFYLLTFLEGCRRQIFAIFASFALILVYRVPLAHMLALQLVNAILIAVTAPAIGKLVDRKGERGPLTFYSIGLIAVFLGYATSRTVGALYALFLLDNILFSFGVGFTTYLHRIVRKGELAPCVAMGTTMNHVAAVTVPIGGAWLWQRFHNYQLPFWVGATIAAVSLVATRWLPYGSIMAQCDSQDEPLADDTVNEALEIGAGHLHVERVES
ncbi:MAG: MFS transporter [Abitibacteriaceae bacterium]|nr:MFS transporter [Abditibacteriaceae bacterium]MBV9866121.1 MFS transporter [Abditibacteriaceae bacterium]